MAASRPARWHEQDPRPPTRSDRADPSPVVLRPLAGRVAESARDRIPHFEITEVLGPALRVIVPEALIRRLDDRPLLARFQLAAHVAVIPCARATSARQSRTATPCWGTEPVGAGR